MVSQSNLFLRCHDDTRHSASYPLLGFIAFHLSISCPRTAHVDHGHSAPRRATAHLRPMGFKSLVYSRSRVHGHTTSSPTPLYIFSPPFPGARCTLSPLGTTLEQRQMNGRDARRSTHFRLLLEWDSLLSEVRSFSHDTWDGYALLLVLRSDAFSETLLLLLRWTDQIIPYHFSSRSGAGGS